MLKPSSIQCGEFEFFVTGDCEVILKKCLCVLPFLSIPNEINFGSKQYKVVKIGYKVFENNKEIQNIIIPANVKSIGYECFANSSVQIVEFAGNSNLHSIEGNCFKNCKELNNIFIPASLKTFGCGSFSDSSIQNIEFENNSNLEIIEKSTFSGCQNLINITIPKQVKKIDDFCFSRSSIQNINFEGCSRLESIGKFAFEQCRELYNITIPPSLKRIGNGCFCNSSINNIEILSNYDFVFENGMLMNKNRTLLIHCIKSTLSVTIPSTIKYIGDSCFQQSSIAFVDFEKNSKLESIGASAFAECKQLENISFFLYYH